MNTGPKGITFNSHCASDYQLLVGHILQCVSTVDNTCLQNQHRRVRLQHTERLWFYVDCDPALQGIRKYCFMSKRHLRQSLNVRMLPSNSCCCSIHVILYSSSASALNEHCLCEHIQPLVLAALYIYIYLF